MINYFTKNHPDMNTGDNCNLYYIQNVKTQYTYHLTLGNKYANAVYTYISFEIKTVPL